MNIHEYQAKNLFSSYGIVTPESILASSMQEGIDAYERLGSGKVVAKAQLHSGGRGKAGGVKLLSSKEEVVKFVEDILGKKLVTKQTEPDGRIVENILFCKPLDIKREIYLSLTVDRANENLVLIICGEGGVEIEELSKTHQEKILKLNIPIEIGMKNHYINEAADFLGLTADQTKKFSSICKSLYRLFIEKDCSLIEINPLAISNEDDIVPIDSKISFDDNALFRHPDIAELKDEHQENEREVKASKCGLIYVDLTGNIGCLVNGAGLAMATMDAISEHGGHPANFLDVGGGADSQRVKSACEIILSDKNVEGIVINIFGGITSCESISKGVVEAIKSLKTNVPIVVRLEGNGVVEGKKILRESNIKITVADSLDDAAIKMIQILSKECA